MRSLLALALLALLCLGLSACGGSTTTGSTSSNTNTTATTAATTTAAATTSTASETPPPDFRKADSDRDNDVGAPSDDTSNKSVLDFGKAASASDEQAIAGLVKRYYAAALAQDGAKACALLYSTLAEAVPEDYGQSPPGPPYMRGTTCPTVMTLLFKHEHHKLAVLVPLLDVSRVRLEEHHGLVVLRFGKMPERQIPVAREGHVWKVEALLDSELP
jgi:hypothetical protein